MKEITQHMQRSESTVLKLHYEQDLPIVRIGGIWESDTDEISKWHKQQIAAAPPAQRNGYANGKKKAKRQTQRRFQ
jgi:hypothetical protein